MEVLYPHCAGLDVHKETVVACVGHVVASKIRVQVRTFQSTAGALLELSSWLAQQGVTHIVMEATGVYWKPVWHILSNGEFQLVLANAAQVKNVRAARPTSRTPSGWLT